SLKTVPRCHLLPQILLLWAAPNIGRSLRSQHHHLPLFSCQSFLMSWSLMALHFKLHSSGSYLGQVVHSLLISMFSEKYYQYLVPFGND
ncbi:hypothetical protein P692DRAFT_20923683, partial [Suillus brevipes Sb2]